MGSDLLKEIFFRLPISSLFHCRSVCRSWRETIRSRDFAHIYTSQSLKAKRKSLIVQTRESKYFFIDRGHDPIPTSFPMRQYRNISEFNIIGSSNGVLCLANRINKFQRIVYNPFLGEFILIPPPTYDNGGELFVLRSEFGFCPQTKSYIILDSSKWSVMDGVNHWKDVYEEKVYRLGDSHWENLDCVPYKSLPLWTSASLVNSVFHWVEPFHANLLCVFDLAAKRFNIMKIPPKVAANKGRFSIGEFGNCLSITSSNKDNTHVWVMKEYGVIDSWEKYFVINLPQLYKFKPSVHVFDFQEEDDDQLFISFDHQFGTYDLKRMEFKKMDIVGYEYLWFNVVRHSCSLISLFDSVEIW